MTLRLLLALLATLALATIPAAADEPPATDPPRVLAGGWLTVEGETDTGTVVSGHCWRGHVWVFEDRYMCLDALLGYKTVGGGVSAALVDEEDVHLRVGIGAAMPYGEAEQAGAAITIYVAVTWPQRGGA